MAGLSLRGSCLCGAVAFEVTGAPLWMAHCHCDRCRKVAGPFGTTVTVRAEHFRWVRGESDVVRYTPPAPRNLIRRFCRHCGRYLGEPDSREDGFPIAASAFDDDPVVRGILHEYVAEKPSWVEICDEAEQYDGAPPIEG